MLDEIPPLHTYTRVFHIKDLKAGKIPPHFEEKINHES
jgi:hypothetical protein